jgi:DNA-directed RNA polymerase specialized sigma24 family protein
MAKRRRSNYDLREVRELVENYEQLKWLVGVEPGMPLHWLVRFIDLKIAVARLGPKEYQAVLLCGLIGISSEAAGKALGVSHNTMWARYTRGLEMLVTILNGHERL